MGFVRKITGADAQIKNARREAEAAEKNNEITAAANKQAADAQAQQMIQSSRAAADTQAMLQARTAAEDKARTVASQPLATANVQLDGDPGESSAATRSKRRAQFGRNYSSGVSI